jgi:hypothetical protein
MILCTYPGMSVICNVYSDRTNVLQSLHKQGGHPDGGGIMHLWNVGLHLREYTELYSRILSWLYQKSGDDDMMIMTANLFFQASVSFPTWFCD